MFQKLLLEQPLAQNDVDLSLMLVRFMLNFVLFLWSIELGCNLICASSFFPMSTSLLEMVLVFF